MDLLDLYFQNEYDKLGHGWKLDKYDHMYLQRYYNPEFKDKREENIKLLEIGVARGVSMRFWNEWFINGEIHGMDLYQQDGDVEYLENYNIKNVKICDALDKNIINKFDDGYFDYIIDDGSHELRDQLQAIELWLQKIKPNGKLIVEDIRNISYIPILIDSIKKNLSYEWNLFDLRHLEGRWYQHSILLEIIRNDKG